MATILDNPSPRQRWDQRYITLPPANRIEPTPFVVTCLARIPTQGRALDVAAGAGRHSLALARHGLRVDAVDISWPGLRLARQRAIEAHLAPGEQIHFIVADIERPWLPRRLYDVILVSFFLHRPLFPLLKDRLRPGGWLIYETFIVGPETGLDHQPSHHDFFLEPGELSAAFAGFEILFYEEGLYRQRPTARLLARKSGQS